MTYVAVGIAGAQIIGGIVAKNSAEKKGRKAQEQIDAQTAEQQKKIKIATEKRQRARTDLANTYEGMTSISPEAAYANKQNERNQASAIERATRAGASSGEIMNYVSNATAKGQQTTERIAAVEQSRRNTASVAGKQARVAAEDIGLEGEMMANQIENQGYNKTLQKQGQINESVNQNLNYFTQALGALGGAIKSEKMFGGGFDANGVPIQGRDVGADIGGLFGGLFGKNKIRTSKGGRTEQFGGYNPNI